MAASDYLQIFFKNRLHLAGRPDGFDYPMPDGTCGTTFMSPVHKVSFAILWRLAVEREKDLTRGRSDRPHRTCVDP